MGQKLEVRGQVRALGWRDGSSGVFTGSLEGLYEGFGSDQGDWSAFELELANGSLAVEVRQATNMALPPRPDDHPFANGRDPIPELEAQARPTNGAEAPVRTVALAVLPDTSSGIFTGARGEIEVVVPNYRVGGSLVLHTESGNLWMDYLELGVPGALETELWVDGLRSTGLWRGARGELTLALELHHPNVALGTYEGSIMLVPSDTRPG